MEHINLSLNAACKEVQEFLRSAEVIAILEAATSTRIDISGVLYVPCPPPPGWYQMVCGVSMATPLSLSSLSVA